MTVRKIEAVLALVPNASVSVHANDVVTWYDPKVAPVTEEQIQAKLAELQAAEPMRLLREKRNRLLSDSDWTGASDTALTTEQQSAWRLYRQKLRDLPKGLNTEFKVKNVKWPTKP